MHMPLTQAPTSWNFASNASRMAASAASLGLSCFGFVRCRVSISLVAHCCTPSLISRESSTLKQSATWNVHALSPVLAPKSQLGLSSVQRSSRRGRPFVSGAGAGSVRHSCQQSVVALPPPGTTALSSKVQVDEQPSPSIVLPSSHASPAVRMPLPQAVGVQFVSQPSPETRLPSSQTSPVVTTPLGQPVRRQLESQPFVSSIRSPSSHSSQP